MRGSGLPVAAVLLMFFPSAGPARAEEKNRLVILFDGKKAGTEEFVVGPPEQGILRDAAHVAFTTPAGLEVSIDAILTLREDQERLRPVSYVGEAKAGDRESSVRLAFDGGRARGTLRQGERERPIDIEAQPDVLILDDNVFHPYRALYRRYDFDRGGLQTTPLVVPSSGAAVEARLERRGTVRVKRAEGEEPLERIAVAMGDFTLDLYGTREGKFLFLKCEEQRLTVAVPGYEQVEVQGE